MSSLWQGELRNSATDVFIDSALVLFTVCAYVPQISRLWIGQSTRGVSASYNLFNIFFSNAQFSETLLCASFAWPTAARPTMEQIGDGSLKGIEVLGGILGLLHIFVQWYCSIAVLLLFIGNSAAGESSSRNISIMAFSRVTAVIFPVVAIARPTPATHTFAKNILIALISMSKLVVAPCFVVLQFYAQYREMQSQHGSAGALSLLSLSLQTSAIALMGIRWLLHLGRPTWGDVRAPIWLWYHWSFPTVNYFVYALGCAFLLACHFSTAPRRLEHGDLDDRTPLLG